MKYIIINSIVKIILSMVLPVYIFNYLIEVNKLNLVTIFLEVFIVIALVKTTDVLNKIIFDRLLRNN